MLLSFVVLLLLAGHAAQATLVDMQLLADAYVHEAPWESGNNHGAETALWAGYYHGPSYSHSYWVYLKFDVSPLRGWGSVDGADLNLWLGSAWRQNSWPLVDMPLSLYRAANDTWDELTLTADNDPGSTGSELDCVTVGGSQVGSWVTWRVPGAVMLNEADGDGTLSLVIPPPPPGLESNYGFDSRESLDETHRPGLQAAGSGAPSVPEPASCALLALAVGGVGAMLKRRRRP